MLPATLLRHSYWEPMHRMQDVLDGRIDHWMLPWPNAGVSEGESASTYPVDIHEDDQKIYVDAEMPGFKATDIEITLGDGVLKISGDRVEEEKEGTKHLYERRHRKIHRRFKLPNPVEEQGVNARLTDGVLHLELGKLKDGEPTRIEVK